MSKTPYNSDKIFIHKQWDKSIYKHNLSSGSITLMPKPPGGEQLKEYIGFLNTKNINVLVSLLQYDETTSFSLINEGSSCKDFDIEFINFQIKDHDVPQFFLPFNQLVEKLASDVKSGKNIAIHCYAGIGRTGITAASILIKLGFQVDQALIELSQTRGLRVPETLSQITWLHRHADQLLFVG